MEFLAPYSVSEVSALVSFRVVFLLEGDGGRNKEQSGMCKTPQEKEKRAGG